MPNFGMSCILRSVNYHLISDNLRGQNAFHPSRRNMRTLPKGNGDIFSSVRHAEPGRFLVAPSF